MKAKKTLGQNFLVDKNKIKEIISKIPYLNESIIIEVGPGKGALTKDLVEEAKKVYAIEIDLDMVNILNSEIHNDNFELIHNDILKFDLSSLVDDKNKYQFVSNLPYYISTKIMFQVVMIKEIETMSIMLQKELVDRIFAKNNTKNFGRLTVAIGSLFELEGKVNVPSTCFIPKPNVDSGFIILKRKDIDFDIQEYLDFVKKSFSNKRKTLLNSLKNSGCEKRDLVLEYLEKNNIPINIRSEQISVDDFITIYKYIS